MADTGAGDGAENTIAVVIKIIMSGICGGDEAAATEERLVGVDGVGFLAGRRRRRVAFGEGGEEEVVVVVVKKKKNKKKEEDEQ
ncbi:hypothetical protein SDJN03_27214, partial [Cucurbita argyrosperma subsp. sororia]